MSNPFRSHPYRTFGAATVLAGLVWLAFGYFGVHTLFVDDVVSEAAPVFDAPTQPADTDQPVATDPAGTSAPPASSPPPIPTAPDPDAATEPMTEQTTPPAAAAREPEIVTEYVGEFVADAHPTSGRALVLGNGTDQRFLRFEDFGTDNGPDLNVYLVNSSTGDVSDYVDLGDLKGNIGEQNYEIPADVDLAVYDRVVIWCVRFGVGFGNASLTST